MVIKHTNVERYCGAAHSVSIPSRLICFSIRDTMENQWRTVVISSQILLGSILRYWCQHTGSSQFWMNEKFKIVPGLQLRKSSTKQTQFILLHQWLSFCGRSACRLPRVCTVRLQWVLVCYSSWTFGCSQKLINKLMGCLSLIFIQAGWLVGLLAGWLVD